LGATRQPVSERSECTAAQGYRRFRCRACGKQFNERSAGVLNRTQYPSDMIALVVLWRLRYKLALRDLPEMFLIRGIVFCHEAVRDWETKLTPALAENLQRRRRGKVGWSWYVAFSDASRLLSASLSAATAALSASTRAAPKRSSSLRTERIASKPARSDGSSPARPACTDRES
jgi:hypothetical protein